MMGQLTLTETLVTILIVTLKPDGSNPNHAMSDCYIQAHDGMDGTCNCNIMQKLISQGNTNA